MKAKKCHAFFVGMTDHVSLAQLYIDFYHTNRWGRMGYNAAKKIMKYLAKIWITALVVFSIGFVSCERPNVQPNNDDNENNTNTDTTSAYTPNVIYNAVTDIDGNVYDAVEINGQIWMNSNLKVTRYADGTELQASIGYVSPHNDVLNNEKYGLLYSWFASTRNQSSGSYPSGIQGLCPNGWHIPSSVEWSALQDYVSHQEEFQCNNCSDCIAKSLASNSGWAYSSNECTPGNNSPTNNVAGFSAMPSGYLYNEIIDGFGTETSFWSCTNYSGTTRYVFRIVYNSEYAGLTPTNLSHMYSVRCVKD